MWEALGRAEAAANPLPWTCGLGRVSLAPNQALQFASVVTGASDQSVSWTITPSVGNITSSGLYTAPTTFSSGQIVTVKATSHADPTKSAYAIVNFYSSGSTGAYPLLGSFLNFYRNLTPDLWAKEFDLMQQISMNTIVVFSVGLLKEDSNDPTGYSLSGEGLRYPSMLVDVSIRPTDDQLEMILSLADQRGMKVYLGSLLTSKDWSTGKEFSALRKYNRLVAQEILARYGQHQSLEGWFFSQELWMNWMKTSGADYYGTKLLANFVADMRTLDATKPVSVAVVFKETGYDTMPGLTPADLQSVTTTFLQQSGVQLLMPEDGAGAEAGAPPLSDLPSYFQAFKLAIDAAGTGTALWSTVETFNAVPNLPSAKFPPASASRVQQQVNSVRPFVTSYVNWIFGDDMSSQATYYPIDASGLNRDYQSIFQPDAHPALAVFTPQSYTPAPPADPSWPDSGGELTNRTGGGYSGYDYSDWAGWWQDNTHNHLAVTLDLGSVQWIRMVRALSLSQGNSGIYHPQQMLVEVSTDGQNYSTAGTALQSWPPSDDFSVGWTELPMVATARYLRLTFSHVWWLFLNELEVLGIHGAPQQPSGGITVSVDPSSVTLLAGETQQFTATVTGTSNTGVTWSLASPAGSISSSGMYSAPTAVTAQQTTAVRATSVADPSKSAMANIVIQPNPTVSPMVGPVNPNGGTGVSQVFQFTAQPRDGDLNWVGILINSTLNANSACFISYYPTEGDLLALSADDSTNDSYTWAGAKAVGESGQLSNSQCTIDTGSSSVIRTGLVVQINLNISFKPGFRGIQQMFMAAQDAGGNTAAWPYVGYWEVP